MLFRDTDTLSTESQDKQLQGITLEPVLDKRHLDQAMGRWDGEERC
jgi:hypothetical protein